MSPGPLIEPVIERQGSDIEPDIRCTLHIVVAAENVCAVAECANVAGDEQCDTAGADVCGPDGMLRLAHAPNQRCRLLLGKYFRDPLQLLAGDSAHPFDLFGRPLRDLLADLVDSVDTLADKL